PVGNDPLDLVVEPQEAVNVLLGCDSSKRECAPLASLQLSFLNGRLASMTALLPLVPADSASTLAGPVRGMLSFLTARYGAPTRTPLSNLDSSFSTISTRSKYAPLVVAIWSWAKDGHEVASITVRARAYRRGAS